MAKVKQVIRRKLSNPNAKYRLTYATTYKLRPASSSSYKYTVSNTVNLAYK